MSVKRRTVFTLLLLPTAVGTSNDQKKQKIKAVHYTWLTILLLSKSLLPCEPFYTLLQCENARISFGAIVIFSAFQHADKTL